MIFRSSLLAVALSSTLLVACGSAPRTARSAPLDAPRVALGDLDAKILLQDLPAHAMRLGGGPLSLVASGEVVEGERIGAFVDVPEGICLLAYARGSSSLDDIDVAAFAEEGNPIASDEGPDAHPAIVLCPGHRARVYVVAHVASGEGLLALAAQEIPRDKSAEIAKSFSARGGAAGGSRPADAWPGLEDHVRTHRQTIGGTWEEIRRVAVTLDARAPTLVGFTIEADQCLDVVVIPDEDVAMVELEAQDAEGRVVGRSRDSGRDRTLTICSPISFDGSIALRPHVGSGLAAVVLGRAASTHARELSGRAQIVWTAASVPLEAAKKAREIELVKNGYGAATTTASGALVVGRRASLTIDLAARGAKSTACSRVDVVGGEPLGLVDAELWDDKSQLITRAQGSSSATVFSCGHIKAEIDLEARGRPGPFSILARPERWQDPTFAAHPVAAARMLAASASGPTAKLEGAPSIVKVTSIDTTHRATFDEQVKTGQCLDVAFGGEGEGSGLEVRMFDASTSEEIDRDSSALSAKVRGCATAAQPRAIRIEVRLGGGKLDVLVGERTRPAQ
ncbi:MAG: hypothetical protein ABI461_13510 [Polyangiaceae bacterium]